MILHLVNKSPFEKNSLTTCLRLSSPGDCILLLEDGIYAARAGTATAAKVQTAMADGRKFYAIAADLAARGVDASQCIAGVNVIDYERFVALAAAGDKVQSWF